MKRGELVAEVERMAKVISRKNDEIMKKNGQIMNAHFAMQDMSMVIELLQEAKEAESLPVSFKLGRVERMNFKALDN